MKKIILLLLIAFSLSACHQPLPDRGEKKEQSTSELLSKESDENKPDEKKDVQQTDFFSSEENDAL